jgi:glycosyltransferase involved in cell wall biosynthesis
MKVYWLITSEFPPNHGGGISTYCINTAKMLVEQGYQVTVFTIDHQVTSFRTEFLDKLRVIYFNPERSNETNNLGYEVNLSLEFSEILEQFIASEGAPYVIETQEYMGIGYYTLLKKKLLHPAFRQVKIVVTMHAPSFLYFEYNRTPRYRLPEYWWGELEKASMNMADILLSPSNYLVHQLQKRMQFNGPEPKVLFNPYRIETNFKKNEIIGGDLVFFGKLTPQKGCLELFECMKELWDEGFDYPLKIIGGGSHFFYPEMSEMEDFLKKRFKKYFATGKILFEGNIAPSLLAERLRKAQVVIVPSIVDNLPYAVIEAMGLGNVVLASKSSGHIELINHNFNGFLFDHNKKGDFKTQLKNIIELNLEEHNKIGKNAYETVCNLLNYEKIYEGKSQLINQEVTLKKEFPFNTTIELNQVQDYPTIESKLSIVIPFYNLGDYLEETIISLLNIDYPNFEIIVVNDGSTEESSILKLAEISNKYKINVLTKKNEGLSMARNYGAEMVDGEFLAFIDADDTVEPNYYAKAIKILQEYNNVSFVGCWAKYFGKSNDIWPTFNPEPPYLLFHNMINSSGLVYKKNHFLSFGINDPTMIYGMEDYDSVISMTKNGARGVSIPEKLWNYRVRENSMQQSFNLNKQLFLYERIASKHKDFFNQYATELSLLLNSNGSGIHIDNPTKPIYFRPSLFSFEWKRSLAIKLKKYPTLFNYGKKVYKKFNKYI